MKLTIGQRAPQFEVKDIWGNHISLYESTYERTLICFLRYAECAVCQLRISEIMRRKEALRSLKIRVIAVFQSPAEQLQINIADKTHFDFPLLADPDRKLYQLYGVKASWTKLLRTINPQGIKRVLNSMKEGFKPGGKVDGLFHQIPADFLLDKNLKIIKAQYGRNVIDHIPLEQILAL